MPNPDEVHVQNLMAKRGAELRLLTKAELRLLTKAELVHMVCAVGVRAEQALAEQREAMIADLMGKDGHEFNKGKWEQGFTDGVQFSVRELKKYLTPTEQKIRDQAEAEKTEPGELSREDNEGGMHYPDCLYFPLGTCNCRDRS